VNLSDLAASAEPAIILLNLTLPHAFARLLGSFTAGRRATRRFGISRWA